MFVGIVREMLIACTETLVAIMIKKLCDGNISCRLKTHKYNTSQIVTSNLHVTRLA